MTELFQSTGFDILPHVVEKAADAGRERRTARRR
jgi:hypothetical protein